MNTRDNAEGAFGYLKDLQETVGARLPGTPGESQSKAWLEQKCQALDLVPERDEFLFRPDDWHIRLKNLLIALAIMALTLRSLVLNPWLILTGVAFVFVVDSTIWPVLSRRTAKTIGHNILVGITRPWAQIKAADKPLPLILLCAHYDTAPASPAWRMRLRRFDDTLFGLAFVGVLGLVGFCLIYGTLWALAHLAGWGSEWGLVVFRFWSTVGVWVVVAVGLPGTLLTALGMFAYRPPMAPGPQNPGADDNGSGVAVVMALAAKLKGVPPPGWDVVAAFWGAEELDLLGSYSFVEKYRNTLDRSRTVIINVDTVGRGNCLMAVSGQGVFRRQRVDESLLRFWEQACASVGARTIREWLTILVGSSDHAAWLESGFGKALSIGRGDLTPISLPIQVFNRVLRVPTGVQQTDVSHVHSSSDCLQGIRRECLEETFQAIHALVTRL